jgi:germination protein YpeB
MNKNNVVSIDITKKGGHVLQMIYTKPISNAKLKIDKAKEYAKKFLISQGYMDMVDTYYMSENGMATINYAYKQDNVVVYPDLIKVKVALDNGEIIGFESSGYISSHTKRDIKEPKITLEDARRKINPRVQVLSSGMAIIPTESQTEILTYEFKGKVDDRDFLVYINTDDGQEEKVLMIVNTPNGILTM